MEVGLPIEREEDHHDGISNYESIEKVFRASFGDLSNQ